MSSRRCAGGQSCRRICDATDGILPGGLAGESAGDGRPGNRARTQVAAGYRAPDRHRQGVAVKGPVVLTGQRITQTGVFQSWLEGLGRRLMFRVNYLFCPRAIAWGENQ